VDVTISGLMVATLVNTSENNNFVSDHIVKLIHCKYESNMTIFKVVKSREKLEIVVVHYVCFIFRSWLVNWDLMISTLNDHALVLR
jgi:hypothetical protein